MLESVSLIVKVLEVFIALMKDSLVGRYASPKDLEAHELIL